MNKDSRKTQFEIERIFTEGNLSQKQQDKLTQICEVLGKYMIVDREILNYHAKEMFGEKIGLSYILRAATLQLITESVANVDLDFNLEGPIKIDGKHFYYQLSTGGLNLMRLSKEKFRQFNILDKYHHKKRVLLFNYFLINENLDWIHSKYSDIDNYFYFHCQDKYENNIIAYFEDEININEIKIDNTTSFDFKAIRLEATSFTDDLVHDPYKLEKLKVKRKEELEKRRNEAFNKHRKLFELKRYSLRGLGKIDHYKLMMEHLDNLDCDFGNLMTEEEKKLFEEWKEIRKCKN